MNHSASTKIQNLTVSAVCLALAYTLPFLTFGNARAGQIFCLMHIPVLLCGFLCGWQWGCVVGACAPLLRMLTLGMPRLPTAGFMAVELAVYGFVAGLLYRLLPKRIWTVFVALVGAMLAGRLVNGLVKTLFYMGNPNGYSLSVFLTESFVTALPGIVIQILLIPAVVLALRRDNLFGYRREKSKE